MMLNPRVGRSLAKALHILICVNSEMRNQEKTQKQPFPTTCYSINQHQLHLLNFLDTSSIHSAITMRKALSFIYMVAFNFSNKNTRRVTPILKEINLRFRQVKWLV